MPQLLEPIRSYEQARYRAEKIIRDRNREWFDATYLAERERLHAQGVTGKAASQRAHANARVRMRHAFSVEMAKLREEIWEPGRPNRQRTSPRRRVNLRKPLDLPRGEIDPTDAEILLDRGMTVREIAAYDNCTQAAVLRVLVPLLAGRATTDEWGCRVRMPLTEVSARLGVRSDVVMRFWPADTEQAA